MNLWNTQYVILKISNVAKEFKESGQMDFYIEITFPTENIFCYCFGTLCHGLTAQVCEMWYNPTSTKFGK